MDVKFFQMKKIFSKSKTAFAIILGVGLLAVAALHSCDKAKQFEGTTWNCNSFDFPITYNYGEEDTISVNIQTTITISFRKKDADIVARLLVANPWTQIPFNRYAKGTATYLYDKGKMSLEVLWNTENMIDDGIWTGTADKKTMTLNNVFGKSIKFTKK